MKSRTLFLSIVLSLVLVIVLSLGGLLAFNLRRMLPEHDGLVYLPNLDAPVEIVRDETGIPHIYASSAHDLFYAQGYVHAQDRWWQMEFERHTATGRIGELTGFNPSVVGNDLFIRTVGWNRASEADLEVVGDETQAALDAYSAGVNAYLANKNGGALALEYSLLGVSGIKIEVEPWAPLDSLAWVKVMAWGQSGNWGAELARMELAEQLGQDFVNLYSPLYPYDQRPTILTTDDLPIGQESAAALTGEPQTVAALPVDYQTLDVPTGLAGGVSTDFAPILGAGVGSNSWVVAGQNTASGSPLLANDPHLGIQMPSIWYEVGLHCRPISAACPYDVVGFSLPGLPTILIGHNARIGWGLTNAMGDTQDLYILRINPDNLYQYEYNGEWRDMQVVTETIRFGSAYAGAEDDPATEACEGIHGLPVNENGELVVEVRLTHFGPIVTDNQIEDCAFVPRADSGHALALRWTALEPNDLLAATLGMNRAANWEEFRAALSHFEWPSINFVYADVDGNIGYQLPFHVPVRASGHDGRMPVPGWTDEYEWRGYIPDELLPRILNPQRGWIVTANHAVAPEAYYEQLAAELAGQFGADASYILTTDYDFGYRGQRAIDLVSALQAHTVATMAEIQADSHSLHAEELQPYLGGLAPEDKTLQTAIDFLLGWDLQTDMDSPRAALFEVFWAKLAENLWADDLGFLPNGGGHLAWATQSLLDLPNHAVWDNQATPEVEKRDDILLDSLQDAVDFLTSQQGSDWNAWRWGALHTATFVSPPLGQSGISLVESLVNAGPVPVSGSWDTLNRTNWNTDAPFAVRGSISSMRMILDFSDLGASRTIHTTGQSGHPFSAHYRDMVDPWRLMGSQAMRFSAESVEAGAQARLELRPSPLDRASGQTEQGDSTP